MRNLIRENTYYEYKSENLFIFNEFSRVTLLISCAINTSRGKNWDFFLELSRESHA